MKRRITLLTGIPRSGTTMCCHLLNETQRAIALHEPLDPQKIKASAIANVITDIQNQIVGLEKAITEGQAFEHGNKSALSIDNPVGDEQTKAGVRKVVAQRGKLVIQPQPTAKALFIKQNAMFAALISHLKAHFPIIAIVRNPIDVLLSWMSVDLPVNRGHIPGGEKFDPSLHATLNQISSVFDRQIAIYQWFCQQYAKASVPVVRYEDIIASAGKVLFDVAGIDGKHITLAPKQRQYSSAHIGLLIQNKDALITLLSNDWYSQDAITKSINRLTES